MENKILEYVDGRLKESERLEVEKHLAACPACRLRVNEFRAVSGLLDELPMIEPSAAFDLRVHARVAADGARDDLGEYALGEQSAAGSAGGCFGAGELRRAFEF